MTDAASDADKTKAELEYGLGLLQVAYNVTSPAEVFAAALRGDPPLAGRESTARDGLDALARAGVDVAGGEFGRIAAHLGWTPASPALRAEPTVEHDPVVIEPEPEPDLGADLDTEPTAEHETVNVDPAPTGRADRNDPEPERTGWFKPKGIITERAGVHEHPRRVFTRMVLPVAGAVAAVVFSVVGPARDVIQERDPGEGIDPTDQGVDQPPTPMEQGQQAQRDQGPGAPAPSSLQNPVIAEYRAHPDRDWTYLITADVDNADPAIVNDESLGDLRVLIFERLSEVAEDLAPGTNGVVTPELALQAQGILKLQAAYNVAGTNELLAKVGAGELPSGVEAQATAKAGLSDLKASGVDVLTSEYAPLANGVGWNPSLAPRHGRSAPMGAPSREETGAASPSPYGRVTIRDGRVAGVDLGRG